MSVKLLKNKSWKRAIKMCSDTQETPASDLCLYPPTRSSWSSWQTKGQILLSTSWCCMQSNHVVIITSNLHSRLQQKSSVKSTTHNHNAKRLQVFNRILYYSSGALHTILSYTSRMGITISYNNILSTLKDLSKDEAKKLEELGRDPTCGLDLVFDNVQTYTKQWEMRIGHKSVMKVGMAATAVEINGFNPGAVDLKKQCQLICEGKMKMALTTEDICVFLNKDHAQVVGALHWLQILTTYIPQLEIYKGNIQEMFWTNPPATMQLDLDGVHKTIIHPLATSSDLLPLSPPCIIHLFALSSFSLILHCLSLTRLGFSDALPDSPSSPILSIIWLSTL